MRILITNDDGVNSSGIMAAKKAVEDLGKLMLWLLQPSKVVLGMPLTLFEPIRVTQQTFQMAVKHFQFQVLLQMQS